jgi:hypothetical protein
VLDHPLRSFDQVAPFGQKRPPGVGERHRRLWLGMAALAFMLLWYPLLTRLLAGEPLALSPFHPVPLGLAFNSMARHLLAGRFDIDPGAIGYEAFQPGGRTVSYFGIFCALLRVPLVLVPAWSSIDITRLSCLAAVCLGALFQMRAVLLVRDSVAPSARRTWLTVALLAAVLLGGQQIQFLRPSIYQEVVDWGGALAMGFVLLAVRGLSGQIAGARNVRRRESALQYKEPEQIAGARNMRKRESALAPSGFGRGALIGMAIFAGLALLDRVSFGLGLYAALGGVLVVHVRRPKLCWPPALVLFGFACIAGIVNIGRWGNPLVFADLGTYAMSQDVFPERLGHLAAYGVFSPHRLWLGLSYYFLPVWSIVRPDGQLLFAGAQAAMIDSMELPPGSFLLSDPLLVGLCAVGLAATLRQVRLQTSEGRAAAALMSGLAIPPLLMLCAISMTYRYRIEFYPMLVLGALLGFRHLCRDAASPFPARLRAAIVAATVAGIAMSHAMAGLYAVSPWGPAENAITPAGLVHAYSRWVDARPSGQDGR